MKEQDNESFTKVWNLVFKYFNPERRDFDTDVDLYFKFIPEEFSLEDIQLGARYVIQNNRFYPTIAEFSEAIRCAIVEEETRLADERIRLINEEEKRKFEERRKAWEAMTPEQKAENKRRYDEALKRLNRHLSEGKL